MNIHSMQSFFLVASLGAAAVSPLAAAQASVALDADIPMQTASDDGIIQAVTLYPGRAAVTRGVETRSEDLDTQWREKRAKADKILDVDVGNFNKLLKDQPQVQVQRKKKTIS